jgi:3-methyladenine DNA glycosylase AlkD
MLEIIYEELQQCAIPIEQRKAVFFKTGPGDYAEHDQFLGVPTPRLRDIAKRHRGLSIESIAELLQSPINELRLLALMMLVDCYQKGNQLIQEEIFQLYCSHMGHINNWNLVDASAHYIVCAHLYHKDKSTLLKLASSHIMWERRIAIVSTWYFIRKDEFEWTIKIAEKLLSDKHDLIHKAVGWMLREMGKREVGYLIEFLNKYSSQMPRTMLRYAIERLPLDCRKQYLAR